MRRFAFIIGLLRKFFYWRPALYPPEAFCVEKEDNGLMSNSSRRPTEVHKTWRVFALVGVMFCGMAMYYYKELTEFEAQSGFRIYSMWSPFVKLYDAYGKWGVVGANLLCAALFFIVAVFCLVQFRKPVVLPEQDKISANSR